MCTCSKQLTSNKNSIQPLATLPKLGPNHKPQTLHMTALQVTGIFLILLCQNGFKSNFPETKFKTIAYQSQFEKVTVQRSTAELWTVIFNQMMKYQLTHTWFDQISVHKPVIYTYMESYPLS